MELKPSIYILSMIWLAVAIVVFSPLVSADLTHTQNQDLKFSITSNFADNCTLTNLDTPNNIYQIFQEGTKNSQTFNFTILQGNFTELGDYIAWIECTDGIDKVTFYKGIIVTPSGRQVSGYGITAHIALFIFFVMLILTFHFSTRNINFEKWHSSILQKYEHKNIVRVIISSIGYNLMKNKFIWYYLFGLPILLIITDIAYTFGVNSMIDLTQIVLAIYWYGFLLVGVFFFGYLQEWAVQIMDEIKSLDYGVE